MQSLYNIYLKIKDDNIRCIERILQTQFPDRWQITLTESPLTPLMFDELEKSCKHTSLSARQAEVRNIMSTLRYGHEPPSHSVVCRELMMTIIIHFPELTVTNQNSKRHKIYDMYVRFRMSPMFTTPGENLFYGLRTSMYYAEMGSDYCFSHLSGRTAEARSGQWTSFCLGATDFSILCQDMKTKFDKDKFEFLCIQLPDYLSWESIEGRPHRYIKDISERSLFSSSNSVSVGNSDIEKYIRNILTNEVHIPVICEKGGTTYSLLIDNNDDFADILTRNITELKALDIWDPVTKRQSAVVTDNKASEIKRIRAESNTQLFLFKDKPIFFKVLDTVNEPAPVTGPFMVKHSVREDIMFRLNSKFKEHTRNEYTKQCR